MADRYWVGGTGDWSAANTANWSATSGGSSGASVPTSTDNVYINGSSGAGTITPVGGVSCADLDCTGYAGTLGAGAGGAITAHGNVTLSAGGTYSGLYLKMRGGVDQTLTNNGKTLSNFYAEGHASNERTVTIADALTLSSYLWFNYNAGAAVTLNLKDGVTHNIVNLGMTSTPPSSGNRNTLSSTTPGAQATLRDTAGTNNFYHVNISDIAATGGATFAGITSAYDYGNNTGITGLISGARNNLFFGSIA
jgi:hypothetical protein